MSLKKKLGMGIGTAILGLSLVGGGTFAYFSDTAVSENTFAAGTLDLSVNPTEIIAVDNLKPGDVMERTFKLENGGSLDIEKVFIETDYTVTDANGKEHSSDFGKHINVNFMTNDSRDGYVILSKTLHELKEMSPEAVKSKFDVVLKQGGLKVGDTHDLEVEFEFVDNNKDQNEFQGAKLDLEWKFNATQTPGEQK